MTQFEKIKAVRRTLEEIDVRGRDNIDKMLGCMMMLDQIIAEASRPAQEAKDESNISDNG
nr:MAG TPA: neurotoxin [Caudoviricetes sp.]